MTKYLPIVGTILFTLYGQLIVKWRVNMSGSLPETFTDKIMFVLKLVIDPFIFSGFLAAFLSSLCWIAAMTQFQLSHAYPIIVGGLALSSAIFAISFMGESLSISKGLGFLFVLVGIYLIGN